MDAIIDFEELTDFLKNPPSLEPRPDFAKNLSSEETYRHGTCTASMPARRHPRLVRPSRRPRSIPAFDWQRVPHPNQSRPNGRLPGVGRPKRSPHDQRKVSLREKLLHIGWQHTPCVLPHA